MILEEFRFLPNYCKKIAFVLLISAIAFMLLSVVIDFGIDPKLSKTLAKNAILVSLLILVISKDKHEDINVLKARFLAFIGSFTFGVVFAILTPVFEYFFAKKNIAYVGVSELLFAMFFFYFWIFITQKLKYKSNVSTDQTASSKLEKT